MSYADFERELMRATGESRDTLRQRGFQMVEPPELEPLVVDWDTVQLERNVALVEQRQRRVAA